MNNKQLPAARRGINKHAQTIEGGIGIDKQNDADATRVTLFRIDDPARRSTPIRVTDTMTETQVMRLFEAACLEIVS